ncbi:MAG: hypothetical protein WD181_05455 [Solirubrobacterales bacterium]
MTGEEPTEPLDSGDEPTEAPTEKLVTDDEAPTEPQESWAPHQPEVRRGLGILVASILASMALIVSYILAGGLDFKPTPVADPCDSQVWSDPTGLEDTAQQLAFSTLDGAACQLGVSREELTRALASDQATQVFLVDNDISREQFDEAIKAGLELAVSEAENAGAINPLVASGIRLGIQFIPVSELVSLIQGASSAIGGQSALGDLLKGDVSALGEILGGDSGGGTGPSGLEDLIPPDLGEQLRDQLPPEIQQILPEGIEDDLGRQLQQGLDSLLSS